MALPTNVDTGRVEGRFIVGVVDGPDQDLDPDGIPAQGTVTFTASVPYLPDPFASPAPVTILKAPIIGVLDSEGYLCTPDPADPRKPGYRGLRLIATDDPDLSVQGWTWTVTYNFQRVAGVALSIASHSMALPSGSTVDLTTVVKVPSSNGIGLEQAEALAASAQAAATAASQDAQAALTAAQEASQAAQATDEGVAALVTGENGEETRAALVNGFLGRDIAHAVDDGRELLHIIDSTTGANRSTMRLEDTAEHSGSVINIHHRSDGSGAAQTFGLNLANHVGASTGFAIHQYSTKVAMQIDNTDIGSAIYIKNTQNQTMNPGGSGTGAFLQFLPFGETRTLMLTNDLTWFNNTSKDILVQANYPTNYAFGVTTAADKTALDVKKTGTGAGNAATITNAGSGPGLWIAQNGPAQALFINADNANGLGRSAFRIFANTHAAEYNTSGDLGVSLLVQKNGTGLGTGIRVKNSGTGSSFSATTPSGETWRVAPNGEMEVLTAGVGLILKSPNGTRHRISVTDTGTLSATAI